MREKNKRYVNPLEIEYFSGVTVTMSHSLCHIPHSKVVTHVSLSAAHVTHLSLDTFCLNARGNEYKTASENFCSCLEETKKYLFKNKLQVFAL